MFYVRSRISACATAISLALALVPSTGLAEPDRVVANRFTPITQGESALVSMYVEGPDGWTVHPVYGSAGRGQFQVPPGSSYPECVLREFQTFANLLQFFPFNKYLKSKFFNLSDVARYLRDFHQFTDRPFSILLYLKDKPTEDGMAGFEQPGHHLVYDFQFQTFQDSLLPHQPLPISGFVHGSLLVVGGQIVRAGPARGVVDFEFKPLPWMVDPRYKGTFDLQQLRARYPMLWEVGRATRSGPGQFRQLMGMAGADILREINHVSRPNPALFERSAVTLHPMSQEGFDAIDSRFARYVLRRAGPHDAVYVVPLREYLRIYPPAEYHGGHGVLERALQPPLSPVAAERFLQLMHYVGTTQLDFRYRGQYQNEPLIFSSAHTGLSGGLLHEIGNELGISDADLERISEAGLGGRTAVLSDPAWPNVVVDPLTHYSIREAAADPATAPLRAFQIGNLNPELAARDPEYIQAALVAGFDHIASAFGFRALSENGPDVHDAASALEESGVRIMISTHFPQTARALQALGPETVRTFDLSGDPKSAALWEGLERQGGRPRPSLTESVFLFSIRDVMKYRAKFLTQSQADPSAMPLATPGYFFWLAGTSTP